MAPTSEGGCEDLLNSHRETLTGKGFLKGESPTYNRLPSLSSAPFGWASGGVQGLRKRQPGPGAHPDPSWPVLQ